MSLRTAIKSPCIKLCTVDDASGLCLGCGRSLEEIAGWSGFTDTQRDRIMSGLERRLADLREAAR